MSNVLSMLFTSCQCTCIEICFLFFPELQQSSELYTG